MNAFLIFYSIPILLYGIPHCQGVTVHFVHSNTLRDAQKSCFACFRAEVFGFSVYLVDKKNIPEYYQ